MEGGIHRRREEEKGAGGRKSSDGSTKEKMKVERQTG